RTQAIREIANVLVQHHIDNDKIVELQARKGEILKKYNLKTIKPYLDAQGFFPASHDTRSGNLTEILLSQYLQTTSGLELLAYKLTYNGNVDQALKGDDCLLFNKTDLASKIITGEAKFRSKPTPKVVRDMVTNLEGSKRLPISLPFIAQHFTTKGDRIMSGKISDLLFELKGGKVPVVNVGLLLSTKSHMLSGDTIMQVENNLNTLNPNLVILSLGIENPVEIIDKAFELANKELEKRI
ncbi:MAG: DUF1837 domain-containing protein, partial [Chryseobacterium sp.]|nr:DUF1837 domain-containing protein [Chryseobacterium sp.]